MRGDSVAVRDAPAAADSAIRTRGRSTAVLSDVLDGYVSREAAIRDYGADAAQLDEALAAWRGTPELVP